MKLKTQPHQKRISVSTRLFHHPDSKRWLLMIGIILFLLAIAWSQPGLFTMGTGGEKAATFQITGTPSPETQTTTQPDTHQTDGVVLTSLILVLIILLGTLRTIRTTRPPAKPPQVNNEPEIPGKK